MFWCWGHSLIISGVMLGVSDAGRFCSLSLLNTRWQQSSTKPNLSLITTNIIYKYNSGTHKRKRNGISACVCKHFARIFVLNVRNSLKKKAKLWLTSCSSNNPSALKLPSLEQTSQKIKEPNKLSMLIFLSSRSKELWFGWEDCLTHTHTPCLADELRRWGMTHEQGLWTCGMQLCILLFWTP